MVEAHKNVDSLLLVPVGWLPYISLEADHYWALYTKSSFYFSEMPWILNIKSKGVGRITPPYK